MKVLFWVSLVISILLPIAWFGFVFFVFGGCVIPIVTPLMAYICALALIPTILLFPFLLIVDFIVAILLWKRHRQQAFFPLVLIIVASLATLPLNSLAHNLSHKRFEGHLPQYEQAVAQIEKNFTSEKDYRMSSGWMHLSIVPPIAYRENDGSLTIEFLVGGIGPPPRHIVYVYRSNGIIEKGSQTSNRWKWPTRVNEHWFRASD